MKTIECLKCKKVLEEVIEDRIQRAYYKIDLDTADCEFNDFGDILESRYYCPECDSELDNAKVEELLKDNLLK